MTGFHGTAGLAVVTQSEALLFVDSRYWIAAEKSMDPSKEVDPRAKVEGGFEDFLCNVGGIGATFITIPNGQKLPAGSRIGADARLIPPSLKSSLDKGLPAGSKLVCQLYNLVDQVWDNKPMRSTDPVWFHPHKFTGRGADLKLAELREVIASYSSAASYPITPLDDLAWLLNLRGNDTFNQPFFMVISSFPQMTLFCSST
ncbi:hypothetical protein C8J57DRAFT_753403 [Mycena rebaudengoi]|nr:hypothetical protein C8J57DRAFT_753403 [Mycena rebaudengoi]